MARRPADKAELVKIGMEGFAIADKEYPRKRYNWWNFVVPAAKESPSPPAAKNVMDCNHAAKAYGGVVVKDYFFPRKMAMFRKKQAY
nr:hypothetical protein A4A49_30796 [Ipomoea batatas]GMD76582.1 hypothetical protein A4A49_30796 [Ipomoea batatas]